MLSNLRESLEQEEEDQVKKHLIKNKDILKSKGPYGMYPSLLIVRLMSLRLFSIMKEYGDQEKFFNCRKE